MTVAARLLRWLGIAALFIGYPLLAHYTNKSTQNSSLGAAVAIAPVVLIALMLAWRSPQRVILLSVITLLCAVLWADRTALEHHYGLVYWLQHAGMQLFLFVVFGRTLLAGRKPICAQFAEVVHGSLMPQHQIYARKVTVAWTVFFAAMAFISTLLFFFSPLVTWSIFANFITLPLVALMFIAEYCVRQRVLPEEQQTHILDAVRAFWKTSARPR